MPLIKANSYEAKPYDWVATDNTVTTDPSKWVINSATKTSKPPEAPFVCSSKNCNQPQCMEAHTKVGGEEVKNPVPALDLPDNGEEWVEKYFPKGSTIIGKVSNPSRFKVYAQRMLIRTGVTSAEKIMPYGGMTCVFCHVGGSRHPLPADFGEACSCGHRWEDHMGHDCSHCGTEDCYPRAIVTGHWVNLPEATLAGIEEGCTCKWCTRKPVKRGIRERVRRPARKPKRGAVMNQIATKFGLDETLILAEASADFYLLVEMGAMEPLAQEADELFRKVTARLADQLCLYLELACLGEFRHSGGSRRGFWLDETKGGSALRKECHTFQTWVLAEWYRVHKVGGGEGDSRMAAWSMWKEVHKKYGDKVYLLIGESFRWLAWGRTEENKDTKDCGYGGPKWAECIETAAAYRIGGLPSAVFVDQALSLRHNGNIAYNKFFNVSGLSAVIQWALEGDTRNIQHYATDRVRELWQAWVEG